jgi:hypothetical protein
MKNLLRNGLHWASIFSSLETAFADSLIFFPTLLLEFLDPLVRMGWLPSPIELLPKSRDPLCSGGGVVEKSRSLNT